MQLSYGEMSKGFAGMLADMVNHEVISRACENAKIGFGRFVCLGTSKDSQAKLPAAAGDVAALTTLGVALHDHARESVNDSLEAGYNQYENMSILKKGHVWVVAEQDVSPTDTVHVRHTTNGTLTPGGVRKDVDTANAVALSKARFLSTALAGELVLLDIDL